MIPSIVNMQDAFSLKGKNALVTGGNRGLGLAIASAFAQQGANVAIFCRDAKKAAEAIEELKPFGGKYQSFSCDVTDLPNVRKVVAEAWDAFGGFDILVNNAGVTCVSELLDMDEELSDWYSVINTDLNGTVHMTYEVGKRMRDAGKGFQAILQGEAAELRSSPSLYARYDRSSSDTVPYSVYNTVLNYIGGDALIFGGGGIYVAS